MNEVIVSMNNISKSFPGVQALDHVKFELRVGASPVFGRFFALQRPWHGIVP